jgi:hypothetical protein
MQQGGGPGKTRHIAALGHEPARAGRPVPFTAAAERKSAMLTGNLVFSQSDPIFEDPASGDSRPESGVFAEEVVIVRSMAPPSEDGGLDRSNSIRRSSNLPASGR